MAYGLHWEWRGFGTLDHAVLDRLSQLAFSSDAQDVVDRYLWIPGIELNLKVRSWSGGRSIKLKRLVDRDRESGLELWVEDPGDDQRLPIGRATAERILSELGLPAHVPLARVDEAELVEALQQAVPDARVVSVRKRRSRAVARVGIIPVQVERAHILEPQQIGSLGIEDLAGLTHQSPRSALDRARDAVAEMRNRVAPEWETCSYLSAVDRWVAGARLPSA